FFFQAEDGIRDYKVTGVQTCALPIFLVRGQHYKVAILVSAIDLAVGDERRAPHVRLHVVRPVKLPRLGVEAMNEAGEIADQQQTSVRVNRDRRDAAVDFVVAPDFAGLRDVAGPGRVNAGQDADAFAVFRVLANRDVNAVFVKDRCRVDFTDAFRGGVLEF